MSEFECSSASKIGMHCRQNNPEALVIRRKCKRSEGQLSLYISTLTLLFFSHDTSFGGVITSLSTERTFLHFIQQQYPTQSRATLNSTMSPRPTTVTVQHRSIFFLNKKKPTIFIFLFEKKTNNSNFKHFHRVYFDVRAARKNR